MRRDRHRTSHTDSRPGAASQVAAQLALCLGLSKARPLSGSISRKPTSRSVPRQPVRRARPLRRQRRRFHAHRTRSNPHSITPSLTPSAPPAVSSLGGCPTPVPHTSPARGAYARTDGRPPTLNTNRSYATYAEVLRTGHSRTGNATTGIERRPQEGRSRPGAAGRLRRPIRSRPDIGVRFTHIRSTMSST